MWGCTGAADVITLCQDILMWKQSTSCNHLMAAYQSLIVGMPRSNGHWSLLDDIQWLVVGWLAQKSQSEGLFSCRRDYSGQKVEPLLEKYCSAVSDCSCCSFWPQAKSVGKPNATHFHSNLFPHVVLFFLVIPHCSVWLPGNSIRSTLGFILSNS